MAEHREMKMPASWQKPLSSSMKRRQLRDGGGGEWSDSGGISKARGQEESILNPNTGNGNKLAAITRIKSTILQMITPPRRGKEMWHGEGGKSFAQRKKFPILLVVSRLEMSARDALRLWIYTLYKYVCTLR